MTHRSAPTAEGYLFIAPSAGPGQRGVMILDDAGEVVWFHPTTPDTAMNFRAAHFRGRPVLTWWQGNAGRGLGTGTHVIVDSSYRLVARLPAGHGRESDLHEFLLTERGTALVTSYEARTMDITRLGGPPNARVIGGIVQELAVPSGRVLFEWNSFDHVALEESHVPPVGSGSFDYFHVNSIDVDADGHLLVSARNTWGVYKIHRRTGQVLWRLGGKRSDFEMGPGTVFAWQHDARHHADGRTISIFDDGAAPAVAPQSRALVIALDRKHMKARLVRRYVHRPGRVLSRFMGNAQVLENGNVLVGYGSEPYFTEYDAKGAIRLDAKLPPGGMNYRALRFRWSGRPSVPPQLALRGHNGQRTAYASWNGATDVAAWRVSAGPRPGELEPVGSVDRTGFETAVPVPRGSRYVRAVAVDGHGHALGRSAVARLDI
jgi:hypothetical protein